MISKEEVVSKRRGLYSNSTRGVTFNKGDKRVYTPRICVVCSRPLSSLILNENRYVTIQKHTRFHINKDMSVDICTDIESCYRTLKNIGRLIDDVDGG